VSRSHKYRKNPARTKRLDVVQCDCDDDDDDDIASRTLLLLLLMSVTLGCLERASCRGEYSDLKQK
jgi:hypothetical protein